MLVLEKANNVPFSHVSITNGVSLQSKAFNKVCENLTTGCFSVKVCIFAFISLSKNRGNRHSISHKIYIFICSKPGFHNSCFRDNISITFCITQLLQITVSSNINCFTQKKKKKKRKDECLHLRQISAQYLSSYQC